MTKQEKLNQFLLDLADFFGKYYTDSLTDVSTSTDEGAVRVKLSGPADSVLDLWAYDAEITIEFGECHWHVYDTNEPCRYEKIYGETMGGVIDVLSGKQNTYSCWAGGRIRRGGTCGETSAPSVADAPHMQLEGIDEVRFKTWGKPTEIHLLSSAPAGRQPKT
jgi:hypothetical protein